MENDEYVSIASRYFPTRDRRNVECEASTQDLKFLPGSHAASLSQRPKLNREQCLDVS